MSQDKYIIFISYDSKISLNLTAVIEIKEFNILWGKLDVRVIKLLALSPTALP